MSGGTTGGGDPHPILLTLMVVAVNDFGIYWIHRCHHSLSVLWPFHAVHHSAEVLTPMTVYRKHPVYEVISVLGRSVLVGLAQGLVLAAVAGHVGIATIAGANSVYVLFNLAGSNLRHSHLWLRYGTALEHILISPAQHQIHHSRAIRHKDKNFGQILAVWDWMFGTLYVPTGREALEFGLSDERGRAVPQPHGSLSRALIVPFRESWRALATRDPGVGRETVFPQTSSGRPLRRPRQRPVGDGQMDQRRDEPGDDGESPYRVVGAGHVEGQAAEPDPEGTPELVAQERDRRQA